MVSSVSNFLSKTPQFVKIWFDSFAMNKPATRFLKRGTKQRVKTILYFVSLPYHWLSEENMVVWIKTQDRKRPEIAPKPLGVGVASALSVGGLWVWCSAWALHTFLCTQNRQAQIGLRSNWRWDQRYTWYFSVFKQTKLPTSEWVSGLSVSKRWRQHSVWMRGNTQLTILMLHLLFFPF